MFMMIALNSPQCLLNFGCIDWTFFKICNRISQFFNLTVELILNFSILPLQLVNNLILFRHNFSILLCLPSKLLNFLLQIVIDLQQTIQSLLQFIILILELTNLLLKQTTHILEQLTNGLNVLSLLRIDEQLFQSLSNSQLLIINLLLTLLCSFFFFSHWFIRCFFFPYILQFLFVRIGYIFTFLNHFLFHLYHIILLLKLNMSLLLIQTILQVINSFSIFCQL